MLQRLIISSLLVCIIISCKNADVETQSENIVGKNEEYLNLVNLIRSQNTTCGTKQFPVTKALIWSTALEKAALYHSKDMFNNNYFAHESPSGNTPNDRLKAQNYIWRSFGENIYTTKNWTPSPKEVIDAWRNSPSHCENLMNPSFNDMGIAEYNNYFTQVLGSK